MVPCQTLRNGSRSLIRAALYPVNEMVVERACGDINDDTEVDVYWA